MKARIGVDVGGTNTDAVALAGNVVIGAAKAVTTSDVTQGITDAIQSVFNDVGQRNIGPLEVERVHIGTTHFINAIIQRRHLDPVSVIRLCGPSTVCLPPFSDIPADLQNHMLGTVHMVSGGFNFDGKSIITEINEDEIKRCIGEIKNKNIKNIVVSGVFSPANTQQEEQVGALIKKLYPECSVTLSHKVGHLGLLERENASIINESLKKLCVETVTAFERALSDLNLQCPLYLTQNDGTLLSAGQVLNLPVRTFSSGPTNSMRGAAHLSGLSDAIVVDIGGTTSDIGVLTKSLPREAATQVKVGGVRTNFRMPDVLSLGLGGGSIIRDGSKVRVGPDSVGYKLTQEALVFGGSKTTATDIAVAGKLATIGDKAKVARLSEELVNGALDEIHRLLEDNIDQMKTSEGDIDVILVGGGSVLVDSSRKLMGVKHLHKPDFLEVANAVGAALSQVSGSVDISVNLHAVSRDEAVAEAKARAIQAAINAGAVPETVEIVEFADIPAAYQPDDATRLKVKAVGCLAGEEAEVEVTDKPDIVYAYTKEKGSGDAVESLQQDLGVNEDILVPTEPKINSETGMWELSEFDVHCLATGAGILGCGGGGNPTIGRLRAQKVLRSGQKMEIITQERLYEQMGNDQEVISLGFMGAPLVGIEKICSGNEVKRCAEVYFHAKENNAKGRSDVVEEEEVRYISDYGRIEDPDPAELKKKIAAVCPGEIGGENSMEPLTVGAALGLPIVDADYMGRAFPELQMITPFINGLPVKDSVICDEHGNAAVAFEAKTPKKLEDFFRNICIKMGCAGAICFACLGKENMKTMMVPHTMSLAWRLGKAVLTARRNKTDPVQAVVDSQQGRKQSRKIATGKILDVQRKTEGGFNRGQLKVETFEKGERKEKLVILFQNENLVVKRLSEGQKDEVLVCTPDLISVVALDTAEPIPTEELRYGLRVAVLALPAPPQLTTDAALKVVGPQAFGYSVDEVSYKPLGGYRPTIPIPMV